MILSGPPIQLVNYSYLNLQTNKIPWLGNSSLHIPHLQTTDGLKKEDKDRL